MPTMFCTSCSFFSFMFDYYIGFFVYLIRKITICWLFYVHFLLLFPEKDWKYINSDNFLFYLLSLENFNIIQSFMFLFYFLCLLSFNSPGACRRCCEKKKWRRKLKTRSENPTKKKKNSRKLKQPKKQRTQSARSASRRGEGRCVAFIKSKSFN